MEFHKISLIARDTLDSLLPLLGAKALARLDDFLDQAARFGKRDAYKVFPVDAWRIVETQRQEGGSASVRAFLRAAIAQRLLRSLSSSELVHLPPRVKAQQLGQFQRIALDRDATAEWLDLGHDLFQKEFGIAALRLYVAGCQLVDPRCGIPRSLLLRGTPLDWLRNAVMILALGGYRPYFEIHAHVFMLDLFSEEARNECYHSCVDLYTLHPEARGMIAGSWFYDPALEDVSPRLAYLRRVPQDGGAWLLFVGAGRSALDNALATSPTRRQLYEQGKYLPKNYMIIWGKARQRAWARSLHASAPIAV